MTIQELLSDLRIDYLENGHHHCRSGWLQIKHCPFCSSDNYHLGWNISKGYGVCWKCSGHSAWDILSRLGVPYKNLPEILRSLDTFVPNKHEIAKVSQLVLPKSKGPLQKAHRRYLHHRGFDPDALTKLWNLEGIGVASELAWRIFIPIYYRSEMVSWTTRSIGSKERLRYVSAAQEEERIPHKNLVYGIDFCRHSIVIVEGPIDAWAIGPGAGALFGTAFTPAQIKFLIEFPKRYVCFDSSKDAQVRAMVLAEQLSGFQGRTENLVLDAKDPGCASKKELNLVRKVAGL